jgi:hypothetical protein
MRVPEQQRGDKKDLIKSASTEEGFFLEWICCFRKMDEP